MRYLGSIYLPGRGKCLCLFEADHVELVRAANDTAQAPFSSIHEAVALF